MLFVLVGVHIGTI